MCLITCCGLRLLDTIMKLQHLNKRWHELSFLKMLIAFPTCTSFISVSDLSFFYFFFFYPCLTDTAFNANLLSHTSKAIETPQVSQHWFNRYGGTLSFPCRNEIFPGHVWSRLRNFFQKKTNAYMEY